MRGKYMTQLELENKIKQAQEAYYNDTPIMEDWEFDELWDKLLEKFPKSKLLKEIGKDSSNGFKKCEHKFTAGSQQKATNQEEVKAKLKKSGKNGVVDYKLDGCSIVLYYENGVLKNAISRGNGKVGDDITENVKKMNYVPLKLKSKVSIGVRGEVLLSRENKKLYFPDMKNCRNATSGTMKRLDGEGCEHLDILVYDAQYTDNKHTIKTQTELKKWLKDNNFKLAPYWSFKNATSSQLMDLLNTTFENFDNLEYDIDGLVFKSEQYDIADMQSDRPTKQFAIKPEKIIKVTKLLNIDWNLVSGTFTPVGKIKPVELNGTTVKQASLCNISELERLEIQIGDYVVVAKMGMIIPKIIRKATKEEIKKCKQTKK